MAVWSRTSLAKIGRYMTLSADYYAPDLSSAEAMLERVKTHLMPLKRFVDLRFPITYGVLKPKEVDTGIFRLARIQNLDRLFIFGADLPPICPLQFDEYARSEVRLGDIIIAIGGYIGPLGIISDLDDCRLNINRHLARVAVIAEAIDPYYLVAYLASPVSQLLLRREIRGAVQAGINLADLRLHPVFVPSEQDQRSVGDRIRHAEELICRARTAHSEARHLLQSQLKLDKLTFAKPVGYVARLTELEQSRRLDSEHYYPAFKNLIEHLPSEVKLAPLSSHLTFCQRGKQPSYTKHGLPVINSKHVQANRVILDGNRNASPNPITSIQIRYGDVLMNGTGRGTIGRSAPYLQQSEAIPDNHVTILRSPDLDPVFISLYLNSIAGQLQVEMHQRGTSGQLELYPFDIRKFLIWSAPDGLQKELRALHERATAAERKSKELLEQAKSQVEQLIEEAGRS